MLKKTSSFVRIITTRKKSNVSWAFISVQYRLSIAEQNLNRYCRQASVQRPGFLGMVFDRQSPGRARHQNSQASLWNQRVSAFLAIESTVSQFWCKHSIGIRLRQRSEPSRGVFIHSFLHCSNCRWKYMNRWLTSFRAKQQCFLWICHTHWPQRKPSASVSITSFAHRHMKMVENRQVNSLTNCFTIQLTPFRWLCALSVAEHLNAQHSAIKMLHSRVKLILAYIKAIENGTLPPNTEILREAYSLSQRLPVIQSSTFREEYFTVNSCRAEPLALGCFRFDCCSLILIRILCLCVANERCWIDYIFGCTHQRMQRRQSLCQQVQSVVWTTRWSSYARFVLLEKTKFKMGPNNWRRRYSMRRREFKPEIKRIGSYYFFVWDAALQK